MAQKDGMRFIIIGAVLIVIALVAFSVIDGRYDSDTPLENAAQSIGDGIEDAGRDLDPNRTPGEKIGDAADDAADAVQDAVN